MTIVPTENKNHHGFRSSTSAGQEAAQASRRRSLGWVVVLFAVASLTILALLPLTRAPAIGAGITIDSNTVFRPSQSWTDIRFASEQTFLVEVETRPTGVTFDGAAFDLEKIPRELPRAEITVTTWAPLAENGTTAIEFLAASPGATTLWLNVTGLRGDALYDVRVDQVWQARSSNRGGISFSWAASSSQTVTLVAYVVGFPPVDDLPPAAVSDLHVAVPDPRDVLLEWTATGDDGTSGQAAMYDVRYRVAGPINETNFPDATAVPARSPQPAGTRERLNISGLSPDTIYWFAIRAADEVPNWSPISNIVEVLTAVDPSDPEAAARPPAVNGVWFTPYSPQLDVVFTKSMNRTSVEQSMNIDRGVNYLAEWMNDAHIMILIKTPLAAGAAYHLTIEPDAADRNGNPLASGFTFRFEVTAEPQGTGEVPLGIVLGLLAGVAALIVTVGWVPQFLFLARIKRKTRTLQNIVTAQAKRIMELRSRILPRRVPPAKEVRSYVGRK